MPLIDAWAWAVGNFILNFGVLDRQIFEFLRQKLSVEEFAAAKEQVLKVRLKKIGSILASSAENSAEFQALCERLNPLRELRNHIAHGSLLAQLDGKTRTWNVTVATAKDQDNSALYQLGPLGPDALIEASGKIVQLTEDFIRLFGKC